MPGHGGASQEMGCYHRDWNPGSRQGYLAGTRSYGLEAPPKYGGTTEGAPPRKVLLEGTDDSVLFMGALLPSVSQIRRGAAPKKPTL